MGRPAICKCVTTIARYVEAWKISCHFGRKGGNGVHKTGPASSQSSPLLNTRKPASLHYCSGLRQAMMPGKVFNPPAALGL